MAMPLSDYREIQRVLFAIVDQCCGGRAVVDLNHLSSDARVIRTTSVLRRNKDGTVEVDPYLTEFVSYPKRSTVERVAQLADHLHDKPRNQPPTDTDQPVPYK